MSLKGKFAVKPDPKPAQGRLAAVTSLGDRSDRGAIYLADWGVIVPLLSKVDKFQLFGSKDYLVSRSPLVDRL